MSDKGPDNQHKQPALTESSLLREVNHKVQNNLQVIISLIDIYQGNTSSAEAQYILDDMSNRVLTISNIQNILCNTQTDTVICAEKYINDLVKSIIPGGRSNNKFVKTSINVDKILLSRSAAYYVGMILSELVENSVRFSLVNTADPEIHINLNYDKERTFACLRYRDNGCGANGSPHNFPVLKLLDIMSRQLKGTYELIENQGVNYQLTFPINN